jgi:hypothetical protein
MAAAHMKFVADEYSRRIDFLSASALPRVPFFSSVTGRLETDLSATYWLSNLLSPVLFSAAVTALLRTVADPLFIEVGPHSALAGPTRQILHAEEHPITAPYVATLVRAVNGHAALLKTAGTLWQLGCCPTLDIAAVLPSPGRRVLTDLPTYSWHYASESDPLWIEPRLSRDWRHKRFRRHELLGERVLETGEGAPAWRCVLRLEDVGWLRDHEVLGEVLVPAAAFVCMIGEALRQLRGGKKEAWIVQEVDFIAPLAMDDERIEVVTALTAEKAGTAAGNGWHSFTISHLRGEVWTTNVTGRCRVSGGEEIPVPTVGPLPRLVDAASFYAMWKRCGLSYGPRMRALSAVTSQVLHDKAEGLLTDQCSEEERSYYHAIHPATLDSALHIAMIAECRGIEQDFQMVSVPRFIDELYVGVIPSGQICVTGEASKEKGDASANVTGFRDGRTLFSIRGLRTAALREAWQRAGEDSHAGAVLEWRPDIDFTEASQFTSEKEMAEIIALLVHKKPDMNVLHLGAGKTDITEIVLSAFDGRYRSYTCADAGPDATHSLEARFEGARGVRVALLDVSADKIKQDFQDKSFDLVIVSQAAVSTTNGRVAARNCRSLLCSHGSLLLAQDDPASLESWLTHLSQDDFDVSSATILPTAAFSIASLVRPLISRITGNISFVCIDPTSPHVLALSAMLRLLSFQPSFFTLGQVVPSHQPAVFLLDIASGPPFLSALADDSLSALKRSLLPIQAPVLWVTGAAQVSCRDPDNALALGMIRTLRRELGTDIVTMEVESFGSPAWAAVARVLETFSGRQTGYSPEEGSKYVPETEYVFSGGKILISRFKRIRIADELLEAPDDRMTRYLDMKSLRWKAGPAALTKRGCVEVEMKFIGVSRGDGSEHLAFMGVGFVVRVDAAVRKLNVGDRVAIFHVGYPQNLVVLPAEHCAQIPDSMGFEDAVSMGHPFVIAIYALREAARLESGMVSDQNCTRASQLDTNTHRRFSSISVEVLPASQLAKLRYCMGRKLVNPLPTPENGHLADARQVFCAGVDSSETEDAIVGLGISRSRIFSGSDTVLLRHVLAATSGRGMDVLVTTASSFASETVLNFLSPFGTAVFIEASDILKGPQRRSVSGDCGDNHTITRVDLAGLVTYRPLVVTRYVVHLS